MALFKAWQDAKVPCPRVIVYLVEAGAHRMVLLTRLIFARPPAGDGLTAEELDSLAAAARRTLVMRGRRSATATAQLAPADDVDQFGELARERKEAEVRFGERLAAVLGTPV
ncbi:hypothetical protein AB0K40_11765 [Nonomuraea bangladeshensis]|uniref:Uncharacterized protein n=1 Tax=Nonomuraea bangladeshensis TaxID=404385 RepID=A0ABV3H1H9_9ACTN